MYVFIFFSNKKHDGNNYIDFFLCLVFSFTDICPREEINYRPTRCGSSSISCSSCYGALLYFHTWVEKPSNILHGAELCSCTAQVVKCHTAGLVMSGFFPLFPTSGCFIRGGFQSFLTMTFQSGVWCPYLKNCRVGEGSPGTPRQLISWPALCHREA